MALVALVVEVAGLVAVAARGFGLVEPVVAFEPICRNVCLYRVSKRKSKLKICMIRYGSLTLLKQPNNILSFRNGIYAKREHLFIHLIILNLSI